MPITEALLDDLADDLPVRQVLMGAFWTAVVLDTDPARCGMASTLRGESDHYGPPIPEAGRLLSFTRGPGDVPAHRADKILPQADVVAITSTSLINHTFDDLIRLCRDDALVIMLGPSMPLSPVLLRGGVDVLSGTVVENVGRVLRSISQGATSRQIKRGGGLRLLTMAARADSSRRSEGENE